MSDGPFKPSISDTAVQMLHEIFGPAFGNVVGLVGQVQTPNALAEAFRYFNSGILFFGTIVLMWITVFGITNTANDGEALGKKWSTFYTPLRTLVSAATLIPTASGYSGIQIIGFTIIAYSIGFASNLWKSSVSYIFTDEIAAEAVKSVVDDRNFEVMASNAVRMQVCAYAVQKAVNATFPGTATKMELVRTD